MIIFQSSSRWVVSMQPMQKYARSFDSAQVVEDRGELIGSN